MARILLIEDEDSLATGLVDVLTVKGYTVDRAAEGYEGLEKALAGSYDLILLDIELPGLSGFDILKELRGRGDRSRVLMLTSRTGEMDKVLGFELGVDDYVSKPFGLSELLGRIKAVLRRSPGYFEATPVSTEMRFGRAVVDFEAFRVTRDGREVKLPTRAFAVLEHLLQRRGQVVSRDDLIDSVWGEDEYITQRTLNNLVVKIRQVIEKVPDEPALLKTIHGVGYRLDV